MKNDSFNIYRAPILRDMKVGQRGFILINPVNNSIHGTTFLTEEFFILSPTLYLFDDINQVKRYLDLTQSFLFPLEIKRVEKGLSGNDFVLNFYYLSKDNSIGFRLLELSEDSIKLLREDDFIFFRHPNIRNINIDMDEFLLRKEYYYSGSKNYELSKFNKDVDLLNLDIKNSNISLLKEIMWNAVDEENYEIASKIRDEISRRENNNKDKK